LNTIFEIEPDLYSVNRLCADYSPIRLTLSGR